jgi:nitrogen fixation/metabolism regulation signal transduction histidine kinase
VKFLTNPMFLKLVLVLFASGFGFIMAVLLMRRIRKTFAEDFSVGDTAGSLDQLPLHTYHSVIQQLKQQKHELLTLQQAEHRRAKTSESISVSVLSNLSSGVLFFGPNGLVRQANQAAKNILGIASPTGMDAEAIFRCSSANKPNGGSPSLAESVKATLTGGTPVKKAETEYLTPAGEHRVIEVSASRVPAPDGSLLGVACLINDQTPIAEIRRQIALRGEMSAEMAFALRNSLITISGYAQQLAQNRDPDLAKQLAADIAAEAKHLDHTIGGFLLDKEAKTASASSSY